MADLRELLILGLALIILCLLLRAAYVVYRRGKGQIQLSIDEQSDQDAALRDPALAELPNGGARLASVPEGGKFGSPGGEAGAIASSGGIPPTNGGTPPHEENVPLLLDPVAVSGSAPEAPATRAALAGNGPEAPHPARGNPDRERLGSANSGAVEGGNGSGAGLDLEFGAVSITAGERIGVDAPKPARKPVPLETEAELTPPAREPREDQQQSAAQPRNPGPNGSADDADGKAQKPAESNKAEIGNDRIVAVHVAAGENREFGGRELWDFLHAAGLRHDKMRIFSKTEGNREDGPPIFRVANMLNPGTFEADTMDEFRTPGISLFLLLPAPINNLLAFEQMLAVARRVAEAFDGRVLDASRRHLTAQGIEQARRRIREFDGDSSAPSPPREPI